MATYPQQGSAPSTHPVGVPRPLGAVLRELPGQYRRVLTKPSAATFSAELGKAEWRSVWVQLLGWGMISAIIGLLAWLVAPVTLTIVPGLSPEVIQAFVPHWPYDGQIVSVPMSFFIWMGLLYLMAQAFHAQGSFLKQCYVSALYLVPLGIVGSLLALIPYLGLLSLAVFIYGIVLQVYALMAAHRLSGGEATAVVLLPALVVVLLAIVFAVIFAGVLIGVLMT
jgi:hypothetical protein